MLDQLTLNPYAFITEQGGQFIINATPRLRVTLSDRNRGLIDYLTGSDPISIPMLRRFLSPERINELVRKRVLIREPLPLEGRYSRQMGFLSFLTDQPDAAQHRLGEASVLLLGAGAVGSHVLWNLAAIGVGRITVVDFDTVEESNLNRQLMYWPEDIGKLKAQVLCERIQAFNPNIRVTPLVLKIRSSEEIEQLLPGHDLVVKAIDTPIESNNWVNDVCVKNGVAYITGGFLDNTGVVGPLYIPGVSEHCLACLDQPQGARISGTGPTFAPLTTIVSSMISMHAFKILMGIGGAIKDRLLMYDVLENRWNAIEMTALKQCTVCGKGPTPAAPIDIGQGLRRIGFRTSLGLLTLIASILRTATGNVSVGVLMLAVLFISTAGLGAICEDRKTVNRELFIAASIYTVIATIAFVIVNGGVPVTPGRVAGTDLFAHLQGYFLLVVQGCLSLTVLFFLLVLAQNGFEYLRGATERWITRRRGRRLAALNV